VNIRSCVAKANYNNFPFRNSTAIVDPRPFKFAVSVDTDWLVAGLDGRFDLFLSPWSPRSARHPGLDGRPYRVRPAEIVAPLFPNGNARAFLCCGHYAGTDTSPRNGTVGTLKSRLTMRCATDPPLSWFPTESCSAFFSLCQCARLFGTDECRRFPSVRYLSPRQQCKTETSRLSSPKSDRLD
jgi:hypothetical protein